MKNTSIMKKVISVCNAICTLFLFTFFLSSCVKDQCKGSYTYSYYTAVYETTAQVRSNIKSSAPQPIENPGKIVILNNFIFLNDVDKGVHVIDNSNPASPKNVAFISIPGNMDLAIKGNTLYADLYTDLVTLGISDPMNVVVKNYNRGVFPYRNYGYGFYGDTTKIITQWIRKDTTISQPCGGDQRVLYTTNNPAIYMAATPQSYSSSNAGSPIGQGGSMARFALVNNYLYTVDDNYLNVFNISHNIPTFSDKVLVDYHVETIYPFEDKLFIGSNNGMFIYDIQSSPESPVKSGEFTHARSCDPVIADGQYAFITLHSGTTCLGYNNELDVVKLNNFIDASLVKVYNLTSPQGLSKDGNILFICDGKDGLKIFNASDVSNLRLIKQIKNLETYDVIARNNVALVVAKDGLYQFDYSNTNNIHLLSKIGLSNK
jgi:hypothetical protein